MGRPLNDLTILVDNAIKYSARGTVTVSALRQNRQLVIKVEDEGIGIDTQDIERIFERFYRVDKARTRAEGGFGLGLPIAKLHQGTIEVESKKKGGSSFIVKLPLTVQY